MSKYISDNKFLFFAEVDFYTNSITIIKDYTEISYNEMPLLIKDSLIIRNWQTKL